MACSGTALALVIKENQMICGAQKEEKGAILQRTALKMRKTVEL
jgi:hypothetical protein